MKKVAILGLGREGRSVLKFLKRSPKYKSVQISALDQKQGPNYLKNLSDFDLVFRSPGVPYNLPEIQRAIQAGVKFSSATKLFFDLCKAKIIGVTGTKGKGTTSTLIYKILKHCGWNALLAGNIGKSPLAILPKIRKNTVVILELSSFQLQDLTKSPQIAVITDVFPDHMDVHKSMREYLQAKTNICRYQKKSDAVFYFQDNEQSARIAQKSRGTKIGITGNPFHLKKNHLLASTVAAYLGCPNEKICKTLKNFGGLEHRLEFVRKIGGVSFYNDSASTNPQTTSAAVLSLHEPIILIAGGKDKNLDYRPLADAIKKSGNVKQVILLGENKEKVRGVMSNLKLVIKEVSNLKLAANLAYKFAKRLIAAYQLPVTILFSPGAASFDMFNDYADRGKQFKRLVKKIK